MFCVGIIFHNAKKNLLFPIVWVSMGKLGRLESLYLYRFIDYIFVDLDNFFVEHK